MRTIQTIRAGGLLALFTVSAACGAVPKVDVIPQGETVTSESGTSVSLTVSLARRPLAPVDVYAKSANEAEGTPSGALHFDLKNWNQPQTLRVTGVDDALRDGDIAYDVSVYARSARRPEGEPSLVATLHFVNRDDDVARFFALGDLPGGEQASYATSVSAAGDVVVGWSVDAAGDQAVRWTPVHGLVGLGGPSSRAQGVSPDGSFAVGSVSDSSFGRPRGAARFRADAPFELLTTTPDPRGVPPMLLTVEGTVVLNDGRVYGNCIQYAAYNEPLGCRYDDPDHLVQLPGISLIYAADATGRYAGTANAERHAPFNTHAVYSERPLPYPADIGSTCAPYVGCLAAARAFSADGALVVGTSSIPASGATPASATLFQTALVYTAAEGTVRLPDLEGGEQASGAYAVSADGRTIAGFGSDERGQQAVLWRERTPRALEDVVLEAGGEIPDGFTLHEVRALSTDGRVLVGNGSNAAGNPEAFRVVLPAAL